MLAEVAEADARGEIAEIFAEIRTLWGVPYVSAIHRHLATRPGVLEWSWEAVAPAFRSGVAQEAGWRAAGEGGMSPLAPISREALSVWGVDDRSIETVRSVAEGFMRVAPVNMVYAGLLKALLEGQRPAGLPPAEVSWSPPPALPEPPTMVPPGALRPAARAVLMQFATSADGTPFVPGLYRMLAHWPGLLSHLATVLVPRLSGPELATACDGVRARIDAAVPAVLAALPARPASRAVPSEAERNHFLAIGSTYRKTSPELVLLGRLIRDAMPRL